jgi:hypothetical protein
MNAVTVAGPFDEQSARDTAAALGDSNHSVYSRAIRDAEGYDTDAREWFVERDNDAPAARIFGYSWAEIQRKQQRRP